MVFENGNTEQSLPKTKTLIQAKIKKKNKVINESVVANVVTLA